jgi:hypothetical protein
VACGLTGTFDAGRIIGYGSSEMTPEEILTLQKIQDFCHARWQKAADEPASRFPTTDMLTGQKMAFNEVLQFIRTLLADAASPESGIGRPETSAGSKE